jgi:hypothetical protein
MTFPAVSAADTTTGSATSNSTTLTLTYPTNLATGDLEVGPYDGELKLVDGGTVLFWPCDEDNNQTYFVVNVQPPLE